MAQMAELISEDIINSIEALHRVIKDHSEKHDVNDTLAVGTILHVPALYWRDSDGEYPTSDYQNLKEVIDRTNLKIQAFNLKNGRRAAPRLQQGGDRGKPSISRRGRHFLFSILISMLPSIAHASSIACCHT